MDELAQQQLKKQLQKAKRIACERAAELHDLVEERLPAAYEEIPAIAQACYEACQAWAQLNNELKALETQPANPC